MSTLRRARIKASASHLASLAGKRRVGSTSSTPIPEVVTRTNDAIEVNDVNQDEISKEVVETPIEEETVAEKPLKPLLKSRFRPNLSESDQQRGRLRRISGCESLGSPLPTSRIRTISGSSDTGTDSAPVNQSPRRLPVPQRVGNEESIAATTAECQRSTTHLHPGPILRTRQNSENLPSEVFSPPSQVSRTRKITESSEKPSLPPTVFDQRKADHKKKFVEGVPERTRITMFDLIYYNPSDGNRMSNSSSLRSSRAPSVDGVAARRDSEDAVVPNRLETVAERLREEAVDHPDSDAAKNSNESANEEIEDEALPVPQVKVAADGSIILDEASTMIETTAAKKAKEDLLKSPLVFENANQATNYGSWGKKKKNADWSDKDTVKFYKALSVFGTDFSLMEGVFKKRSRHELKMKFKKEEKLNRSLVDKCLSQGQTFDPSIFDSDSEDEDEENDEERKKKEKENRRKKKQEEARGKKRKHRIKGRRYFNDSDDADESELASESEATAPKKAKTRPEESLLKSLLEKSPSFPPALLAANPGLANASPGSLVVVASPSPAASSPISSQNAQLLQVFMVEEEEEEPSPSQPPEKSSNMPVKRTRTISENHIDTTSRGRVRTHSGTVHKD